MSDVNGSEPPATALGALCLGALGVVFGDIGTSPLYAVRECFAGEHPVPVTPENVLGVLSLILWSLVVVISVKYLSYVLRMDNHGEGGIFALTSQLHGLPGIAGRGRLLVILVGVFGACLLYGDGMITPAISVLSAMEGLQVVAPGLAPFVIPITVGVLVGLFSFQRRGTASVGAVFGPVIAFWFLILAALGVGGILRAPAVLAAANPLHAVRFFIDNGSRGFLVLGAVFLVVTGGEALFADLGHFGPKPIRLNWFGFVLPALLLNYFGQGGLLLSSPSAVSNPFYRLVPPWGVIPLVVLAAAATVIASQAVISGAFSLTRQAVQLGYLPRLAIVHTSEETVGQIYVPLVNWVLMTAAVGLVVGFGSSSRLAAAYGVAVTTTMVITTVLAFMVARRVLGWPTAPLVGLSALFLVADLSFFGSNIAKIPHGGWFPLMVAGLVFVVMTTWLRGRRVLADRLLKGSAPLDEFLAELERHPPTRVPGTAVFMAGTRGGVPRTLLHNFKHNKVLHERVVFLTVITEDRPRVARGERSVVEALDHGIFRVTLRFGFTETSDVPRELRRLKEPGLEFPAGATSYFLGRETLLSRGRSGMWRWRERLFALLSRNAQDATSYFGLPVNRVVELGSRLEL